MASRWTVGSRRTFIKSAGAAALTLPFIRQRASAQPGAFPVRLIICSSLNGLVPDGRADRWDSAGGDSSLTLSPMLSALAPVKAKTVAFKGLDNKARRADNGGGHDPCIETVLRGYDQTSRGAPKSASVDGYIASQIQGSRLSQLGVSIRGSAKSPFWTAQGGRLPVERSPQNVYDRVFRDFTPGGGNSDAQATLKRRNKKSILDFVRNQTTALKGELCGNEKEMLDAHLETIQKAEAALSNVPNTMGTCNKPAGPGNISIGDHNQTPNIANAQVSLVAAAVACQLTPVVSFSMLGDYEQEHYPFLPGIDPARDHHSYAHSGDRDQYQQICEWWVGRFAQLVTTLDSIPEGDGTVLDNCIVLFTSDMRVGGVHDALDIPTVMVGGAGGQVKGNRMLSYNGESMNNLLTSLCQLMGVNVAKFGNPALCSGPLARLA